MLLSTLSTLHHFNPRAPCGARPILWPFSVTAPAFQSTRPVWGATAFSLVWYRGYLISIHAPRVGRDCIVVGTKYHRIKISIHAPRVGRDVKDVDMELKHLISIHAPRVGRDTMTRTMSPLPSNFNPRAPCGARQPGPACVYSFSEFQSTRPVWGATGTLLPNRARNLISIHAPRVGRDWTMRSAASTQARFQSTRPVWGATELLGYWLLLPVISIHAPRVGRDDAVQHDALRVQRFQSTRPVWGATWKQTLGLGFGRFQSTRPVWGATCGAIKWCIEQLHFNPRAPCGARRVSPP